MAIAKRNFFRKNRMPRTCGTKIGHVRVCGGSGWATARFYPAVREARLTIFSYALIISPREKLYGKNSKTVCL
jgi:hypothetical protein